MITFDRVDTQEKKENWEKMAKSFDHYWPTPMVPIVTVSRDQKMFGFYTVLNQPIVCPSFHPELTTPRDFYDMVTAFTNVQCLTSISPSYPNGVSFVGLPQDGNFEKLTSKMGYDDLRFKLYRRYPNG